MNNPMGAASNKAVTFTQCSLVSPFRTTTTKTAAADIRNAVIRLDIYEDMFSPTLTGTVELQDNLNLSSLIPLVGLEMLRVGFYMTQDNIPRKYEFPFAIYNQSDRIPQNQGTEKYTLGLSSPELVASTSRRISFAFQNKKVEDVIRELLTSPKYLNSRKRFTDVEATTSAISLVSPYLTPLETIRLLTLQGQSASNETNYVFYENLEGFHFTSFARAIRTTNQSIIPRISMQLAGTTGGNTKDFMTADQIHLVSGFDHLYLLSHGYFASTTFALDVLSGKYEVEISSSGLAPFSARPLMNGAGATPLYPNIYGRASNPTAKMFLVPTTHLSAANTSLTSVDATIKNNFIAQTLDGRNRELLGLQSRCVRVTVSGAPELNVGKLVHITIPNPVNNNQFSQQKKDIATGVYMIVKAKHSIIQNKNTGYEYETTFEAVTDSVSP